MTSLPEIPAALADYADRIRASAKDALRIKLKPEKDLSPWQSKVGGTPYMPASAEYPKGPEGDPLKLLAQINLTETPRLPELPESGILQFYIDPFDEFMGLGGKFDNTGRKRYSVQYFDTIERDTSKLKMDDPFRTEGGSRSNTELPHFWPLSRSCQYSMEFEQFRQVMSPNDGRMSEKILDCDPTLPWHKHYASKSALFDAYEEAFRGGGHQIGGYPFFTQDDPRGCNLDGYELLFQLDSETFGNGQEIIWGDMGVANFFIRPEDLVKRDFTQVMYNWDCS